MVRIDVVADVATRRHAELGAQLIDFGTEARCLCLEDRFAMTTRMDELERLDDDGVLGRSLIGVLFEERECVSIERG